MENNSVWEKAVMAAKKSNLQAVKITGGWSVKWNHFVAANPLLMEENDSEWIDFSEDMALFISGEYTIDLGWYGGLNKNGYYGVSIFKNKETIETFCSNDIDKLTDVLNYFFTIPFQ